MSKGMSMYPVLDNRPIDQWKVTELKEELRRRKIVPKGLKEDLVRRLFEEIQRDNETNNTVELNNGFDADPDPLGVDDEEKKEQRNNTEDAVVKNENAVEDTTTGATADISPDADTVTKAEEGDRTFNASLDLAVNETPTDGVATANSEINKSDAAFDTDRIVKAEDGDNICDGSLGGIVNETPAAGASDEIERSDLATQFESYSKESIYNEKHKDLKPSDEDAKLDLVEPNNQVSEVSTDLGFQVKCESISTDSVSINETIKLNDNSNADNFHLEVEVVKPEMVQPSAGDVHVVGDLHPLVDDKGSVKDQTSLEEIDGKYATSMELSQINDSADGGSPEKLNLDRSSGDESMEEDVLESKNVEFKTDSDKLGGRAEDNKVNTAEEETQVDIMSVGFSPDKKDIVAEEKMKPTAPIIKRMPEENAVVGINEGFKRQRRWNSETIKVPDRQASNIGSSSTPKDAFLPTPKPALARSGSTVSGDTPKERIVPPSQKPATNSLRIDHFVRPFTLKAVQELLAKTGTVCSFWMDHIKTHCFVTYSSHDEAIETRNAVYNLQWPPNGGRHLVADFVDPQEVKIRAEASSQLSAPISPNPTTPTVPPFKQTQAPQPIRQNVFRQQLPPPPSLPLPAPLSEPPVVREQLPPPPPLKKPEPPAATLDDLFKKTKATPRIYYLPLSNEQVAAKLPAQGKVAKE